MKFPMRKGFRTLMFLYGRHGAIMRAFVGAMSFCIALVATVKLVLASEVAARCWYHDDFELSLRRCSWYLRRSWLNVNVSQDDMFDVTPKLDAIQLDALESFLNKRERKIEPVMFAAEKVSLAARRLDMKSDDPAALANLEIACNTLLQLSQSMPKKPMASARSTHKRRFPIENAKSAFGDFVELFPPEDIPWFVISGTFLGLVREQGFIAHDYDIDVGLFLDHVDIQTVLDRIDQDEQFLLKQYECHTSSFDKTVAQGAPYLIKIIHVSGMRIDLFIHHRDMTKSPTIYWHGSSLHRWENTEFELVSYMLYKWPVLGPSDADRYLTENYGDWRTPVTEFNCSTDTPNLALVQDPVTVSVFLRRFALAKYNEPDELAKLKATLIENGFLREGLTGTLLFSTEVFRN